MHVERIKISGGICLHSGRITGSGAVGDCLTGGSGGIENISGTIVSVNFGTGYSSACMLTEMLKK